MSDPIENIIRNALETSGKRFLAGDQNNVAGLDFWLPDEGVYIEVKQFHSPRIATQMARADNVIVVQGRAAAELFASMICRGYW